MPNLRGVDYYNRKDFFSAVLKDVAREDLRFTDVFCGFTGKVHDARVFRRLPLSEYGEIKCNGGHLLGDSAYPNISWLLTPFQDTRHLTEVQKRYNCALAQNCRTSFWSA